MDNLSDSITSDDEGGGVALPPNYFNEPGTRDYDGPEQLEQPIRQPRPPPPGMEAVRLEGFARFIRRHASPHNNRVTAGGRVVPVGPNSPPPTFHLDFIDRVIQAAQNVKQDPTPRKEAMYEDWLEDSNLNSDSRPKEDGASSEKGSTCSDAGATKPVKAESFRQKPLTLSQHYPGTVNVPEPFLPLADMADGSKIVRAGNSLLRAYLNEHGGLAYESLQPLAELEKSLAVEKSSPPAATTQTMLPFAVKFELLTPHALGLPEGFKVLAKSSKDILFISTGTGLWAPVVAASDPDGNVTYAQIPPHLQTPITSIPSIEQNSIFSMLGSGHGTTPPTKPATSLLLNDIPDLSIADLDRQLESTRQLHESKRRHLKALERWLAKEEDVMSSNDRNKLLVDKGDLIRLIDKLRKDKEKLERISSLVKSGPEPPIDNRLVTVGQSRILQQLSPPSALGINVPLLGSIDAQFPFALDPDHPVPTELNMHHLSATSQMDMTPADAQMLAKTLQPSAPNFVPQAQSHNSLEREAFNPPTEPAALRARKANTYEGTASNELAMVHVPSNDSSPASDRAQGVLPSRPKAGKAISIRRPDGTPIDLSEVAKATKASFYAKAQQPITESHADTINQGSSDSVVLETLELSSARVHSSSRSDNLVNKAGKFITWSKRPDETQEDFERRCQSQREFLAQCEQKDTQVTINSAAKRNLPAGVYTNENQQFRRPPLQALNAKATTAAPMPSSHQVQGRISQYSTHTHERMIRPHSLVQGQVYTHATMQAPRRHVVPTVQSLSRLNSPYNGGAPSVMAIHPGTENLFNPMVFDIHGVPLLRSNSYQPASQYQRPPC